MRYEILGSVRIVNNGTVRFISARKIETLLAVLLFRANQVVSHDQLITEIWGDSPPRRVTAGLHVYVSQLRKFLMEIDGRQASPVITRSPGYLLHLGDDELDLHEFVAAMDRGRAHLRAQRYLDAHSDFQHALRLYRGPVLDDLRRGATLEGFASWSVESRLECLESLVDTKLRMGRHREEISRLQSLVMENPLREGFYYRLMLALYRSQRTADALQVFQEARRTLREELGLEPGRGLRELHRAILQADDQLDFARI